MFWSHLWTKCSVVGSQNLNQFRSPVNIGPCQVVNARLPRTHWWSSDSWRKKRWPLAGLEPIRIWSVDPCWIGPGTNTKQCYRNTDFSSAWSHLWHWKRHTIERLLWWFDEKDINVEWEGLWAGPRICCVRKSSERVSKINLVVREREKEKE